MMMQSYLKQQQQQQQQQQNEIFDVAQAQHRQQDERQQQQQQRYLERRQRQRHSTHSISILSNEIVLQRKYNNSLLLHLILSRYVFFLSLLSVVVISVSAAAAATNDTPQLWNLDQQHSISLSVRRPRSSSSLNDNNNYPNGNNNNNNENHQYDRSITTFNPEGRLLQVEYSITATERAASSMSSSHHGGGITVVGAIAFIVRSQLYVSIVRKRIGYTQTTTTSPTVCPTNSNQNDEEESHTTSSRDVDNEYENDSLISVTSPSILHRISDTIWMLTTGLVGDCLYLVQKVRQKYQEHFMIFGECMTVKEASEYIANQIQHTLTIQGGTRPLASTVLLFGYDNNNNNNQNDSDHVDTKHPILEQAPSIYRIYPGGSMERCTYGTVGGGFRSTRSGNYNGDCLMNRFYYEKYNEMINMNIQQDDEESTIYHTEKDQQRNHRYHNMIATISCLLETIQDVCIENQIIDTSNTDEQLIQDIWIFSSPSSSIIRNKNVLCFHNIHDTKDSINAIERYLLLQQQEEE